MPRPDPDTLTAWQKSDTPSLRAAARLYAELETKKHGTPVHSTTSLATRYAMPAHAISTAKHVLAGHGIIHHGPGNRWYVT